MKRIVLTVFGVLLSGAGCMIAGNPADRILGVYKVIGETTRSEARTEFYKKGDTYEARIIWIDNPYDEKGNPLCDTMNPDPELRKVPAEQIVIVRNLKYDPKKEEWNGGTIYDPVSGKTYDVMISFESSVKLKVRGYVGRPVLGKNFFWDKLE